MKAKQVLLGQEAVEVAVIGIILLCLSIGAVVIFGGNIQKIFQNDNSPVIVSAKQMNGLSTDPNNPNAVNSRTDINSSLVTDQLISKAASDSTIGSSVGQETTGATGGDSAIGGTYLVSNPDELHDGDPDTTGNAFLNQAIATKNSALDLLNQALSLQTNSNLLQGQVNNLNEQVQQEQDFLAQLQGTMASLIEGCLEVGQHLDLLVYLEAEAAGIQTDLYSTLDGIDLVNTSIVHDTATNLIQGNKVLDLNDKHKKAHHKYCDLRDTYDSSWETSCDPDTGVCTETNTSGISPADIQAALALSEQLLAEVNGEAAAIENIKMTFGTLVSTYATQSAQAKADAQALLVDAKDLLKTAFVDQSLFNGCTTVQEFLEKATWALGGGGKKVVDPDAVLTAIQTLKDSQIALNDAEKLDSLAQQSQINMNQMDQILEALAADALTLTFTTPTAVDASTVIATSSANEQVLQNVDPHLIEVADELVIITDAYNDAEAAVVYQQSYLDTITSQAAATVSQLGTVSSQAASTLTAAQVALADAEQAIDDIVCYPHEMPCD